MCYKDAFLLERLSTNSDASALKRKLRLRALAHVTPLRAVTVSEPQLACSLTTKNTMFATICASHGFIESLATKMIYVTSLRDVTLNAGSFFIY